MKTVSASEIAAALDITQRSVRRRADKENWKIVKRRVQGGFEMMYVIRYLPDDVRIAFARHDATAMLLTGTPAALAGAEAGNELAQERKGAEERHKIEVEAQLAAFGALPPEKQAIAYARRDIMRTWENFLAASQAENRKKGTAQFCLLYNRGEIRIADHIQAHVKQVSWSTLCRWQAAFQQDGLPGLLPGYCNPKKGSSSLSPEQRDFILGMLKGHPHSTFATLQLALEVRFGKVPGMSAVRRFVNSWKQENASLLEYCTNPDKWRNKRQFALGDASEQVVRLNQVWEFDSTPADVMLADGRYCLIGVIDVYSRRLKLHVSKTSRATAVAALIRRSLLDWGIPEIAKTDNGSDYVSRHIIQVFEDLNIDQVLCPPFTPEAKPHIERAFKTFAHSFQETMPGYIGHSVADRKDIEARRSFAERLMDREPESCVEIRMTAEELQKYCDRWCHAIYHQNRHHGLNNRTPIEVARAWQESIRIIANERALDILLAEAASGGTRMVGKTGVSVDNITYISDALPEVGTVARVKLDPIDLGTIYLFDAEKGTFFCIAQDPLRTGINRAEVAMKVKNAQKKLVKEGAKELKRLAKEQAVANIHEEILTYRESKIENIVEFPVRREAATTPALDQAAMAADAMETITRLNAGPDPITISLNEEKLAAIKPEKKAEKVILLRSDADTYDQIWTETRRGKRKLTKWEFDFLNKYYDSANGRSYMALQGDLRKKVGLEEQHRANA